MHTSPSTLRAGPFHPTEEKTKCTDISVPPLGAAPLDLPAKQTLGHRIATVGTGATKTATLLSDGGEPPHLPARQAKLELRPANPLSHLPKALLKAQLDSRAEHKHLKSPSLECHQVTWVVFHLKDIHKPWKSNP